MPLMIPLRKHFVNKFEVSLIYQIVAALLYHLGWLLFWFASVINSRVQGASIWYRMAFDFLCTLHGDSEL